MTAHQAVDGRDDRRHLRPGDDSVAVGVVQLERPAQFLVVTSSSNHRQARHEILHARSRTHIHTYTVVVDVHVHVHAESTPKRRCIYCRVNRTKTSDLTLHYGFGQRYYCRSRLSRLGLGLEANLQRSRFHVFGLGLKLSRTETGTETELPKSDMRKPRTVTVWT